MSEEEIKKTVEVVLKRYLNEPYKAGDFAERVEEEIKERLGIECEYWFDEYPLTLRNVYSSWGDVGEFSTYDMRVERAGDEIDCEHWRIIVNMMRVWSEVFVHAGNIKSAQGFYLMPLSIGEIKVEKKEEDP